MGQVNATTIVTASIVNSDISQGANIAASKMQHQYCIYHDFGYGDADGSIATKEQTLFLATASGEIREVIVYLCDSGTNTDIDLDLSLNGSSILVSQPKLVHGTGDFVAVSASIATATFTSGDYLTAEIATVTQNTGALGPRMLVHYVSNYV